MIKDILVINAGSSSLKFRLYDFDLNEKANGLCERIGVDGFFKIEYFQDNEIKKFSSESDFTDHSLAIDFLLKKASELNIISDVNDIFGVGHRIVQGGSVINSKLVDEDVLKLIEDNIKLAPLHNKPELDVLKIIMEKIPNAKNIAVFDTSFHTSIPKLNNYYPVLKDWVEKYKIKKYGFHGTSYRYINEKMKEILGIVDRELNLIVCHLGNGASMCCIKDGKSFDTTMGLTPLAGLVMGTRSGDIDSSIFDLISREENLDCKQIFDKLNKESGLKSICGSSDFRDILAKLSDNKDYEFALQFFVQKVVNYISIYKNMLNDEVDAIVFTGGIGENVPLVRKLVCDKVVGISVNDEKNNTKIDDYLKISQPLSKIKAYVVRTNEELKIAQDTKEIASQ